MPGENRKEIVNIVNESGERLCYAGVTIFFPKKKKKPQNPKKRYDLF